MPRRRSEGWIKVYGPGHYRGRDGWHVRGKDLWGRTIEGRLPVAIASAPAAERAARRLLAESNRRAPVPALDPAAAPAPDRSFEAAAKVYRQARRPRDVEWARIEALIACPAIGPVHVDMLTTEQVAAFAPVAKPHVKPDTWNREIVTPYSSVLHFAAELKWCTPVVIRRFREQEDEVRAVQPLEVDRLVAHADATATYKAGARRRSDVNAAYKVALLEYLRLRGTRITDTLNIHRERDLDLPAMRVRLVIGKARDKVRWMELSPKVVALFANLKPCDGGWLFPWRSKSGVYKWWGPLCDRAGVKATPHQFRHALGEEAIEAEVDLLTLTELGAWASLNSARVYARVSRRRMQAADRQREEARRTSQGSTVEMTAGDLGQPDETNVVPLPVRRSAG